MPVLSTLIDNFDDNSKDTSKWASTTVPANGLGSGGVIDGSISETSGAVTMEVTWDGDYGDFVGYSSNNTSLDFHGSSGEARIQIKDIDSTAASTLYFSVGESSFPPGHNAEWQVELDPGGCLIRAARNYFGSAGTVVSIPAGIGTELKGLWLIIRADGTDTVWEIAPNDRGVPGTRREVRREAAVDFPVMTTVATSFALSPGFTFGSDSTVRRVTVDNFNFSPTQGDGAESTVVSGSGGFGATRTTTAVTPTGDNRAVLVFTNTNGDNNHVNEVKYNNDSGTLINGLSEDYICDLFGFMQSQHDVRGGVAPPNASTSIYAEFTGTQYSNAVAALYLENVDQTTPFGTPSEYGGYIISHTPQNVSRAFTGLDPYQKVVAGLAIFQLGTDYNFTITPGVNTVQELRVNGADDSSTGEPRFVIETVFSTYADASGNATISANVTWNNVTDDQFAPFHFVAIPVNYAAGGGGSPITGDLTVTEGSDTVSASDVDVLVTGNSTITQGADTISSTTGVLVSGSASITQGADTVASTAGVLVAATLTRTEVGDTLASSTVAIVGASLTATEGADTLSSGLTHPVVGTASITEAGDTLSSGVTHPVVANATITESGDTLTSSIGAGVNLSLNVTEAPDTVASSAVAIVGGSASISEAGDTVAAATGVRVTATATITESGDTLSATVGSPAINASLNVTEAGDTLSSGLTHPVLASASITEAGDVLNSATGVLVSATSSMTEAGDSLTATATNQPVVNISLTVTEGADTLSAQTTNPIGANASITEVGDSVASSAVALVSAALNSIELPDGVTAQAAISLLANANITEAGDTLLSTLVFNINAALNATEAGDTLIAALQTLIEDAITYSERPLTYNEGELIYQYRRR